MRIWKHVEAKLKRMQSAQSEGRALACIFGLEARSKQASQAEGKLVRSKLSNKYCGAVSLLDKGDWRFCRKPAIGSPTLEWPPIIHGVLQYVILDKLKLNGTSGIRCPMKREE